MNNKKKIISVFLTIALIVTVFNSMVSSASQINYTNYNVQSEENFDNNVFSVPGDTNLCKIIKISYADNVTYNNWEHKIITQIVNAGFIGGVYKVTTSLARGIGFSSIQSAFINIPKSQNTYVTIQTRKCKDSLGIHHSAIITYYKNAKRTQYLYQ